MPKKKISYADLEKAVENLDNKILLAIFAKYLSEQPKSKKNTNQVLAKIIEEAKEISIPLSIFLTDLGPLEAICKYLRENLQFNYRQISFLLKRDERVIWASYQNSVKKHLEKFFVKDSKISVPIKVVADRKLSTLESIVSYLKDNCNLRYCEIAKLLNRSQQNVLTIYKRTKKKNA